MKDIVFEIDLNGYFEGYYAPKSKILYEQASIFIGKKFADVLPGDVSTQLQQAKEAVCGGDSYVEFDYSLTIDGVIKYESAIITPRYNAADQIVGITAVCRDITERKLMEAALQESETKYALIANNSSDSIWAMDADLGFSYLSPSTEKLFGYSLVEWDTLNWNNFVRSDYLDTVVQAFNAFKLEKMTKLTPLAVPVRHKDGTTMWVEFSANAIFDENHTFAGAVGITRDITERKEAQDELQKQLAEKEMLLREIQNRP
jgi:PAS domain S-box-containing protein